MKEQEKDLDLTEDRVWVFKESDSYDGYTALTKQAKSLVNERNDVEWDNLLAKKLGHKYGTSRIAVIEVKQK